MTKQQNEEGMKLIKNIEKDIEEVKGKIEEWRKGSEKYTHGELLGEYDKLKDLKMRTILSERERVLKEEGSKKKSFFSKLTSKLKESDNEWYLKQLGYMDGSINLVEPIKQSTKTNKVKTEEPIKDTDNDLELKTENSKTTNNILKLIPKGYTPLFLFRSSNEIYYLVAKDQKEFTSYVNNYHLFVGDEKDMNEAKITEMNKLRDGGTFSITFKDSTGKESMLSSPYGGVPKLILNVDKDDEYEVELQGLHVPEFKHSEGALQTVLNLAHEVQSEFKSKSHELDQKTYTELMHLLDEINTLPQETKEQIERKSHLLHDFRKKFGEYIK